MTKRPKVGISYADDRKKTLPPPGSAATKITEADRAEIMAHANDVLDYYLNGDGSYFSTGQRKPLIAPRRPRTDEPGDSTIADLKKCRNSVIASRQFGDIMGAVAELIEKTIQHVESVIEYNEGKHDILRSVPSIDGPIERTPSAPNSRQPVNSFSNTSLPDRPSRFRA